MAIVGLFDGTQSALNPVGPEADGIAQIAWVLFGGSAVVFTLVVAALALAWWSPRPWLGERRLVIAGGIALPIVVLSALLVYTFVAVPRFAAADAADVTIVVTGRQWWWHVAYLNERGEVDFVTANEVRIPVGRTVDVRLRSADVLHSFWVPTLAGKLDTIPGRENRLRIRADRGGRYRGQCAEYCGGPHAWMAFFVVAEEPVPFDEWRAQQRAPARAAIDRGTDATIARGRDLFIAQCATCHAVRGTRAAGELGPDLTHFASRTSIGAGMLPNTPATTMRWIVDNQTLKPGNLMPEFRAFTGDELQALNAYLQALE